MPKPAFPAAGEAMPTVFLTVRPSLRASLANTIDSLIALLDEIDGDPDLEPDHDNEFDDSGIADADALHEVFAS